MMRYELLIINRRLKSLKQIETGRKTTNQYQTASSGGAFTIFEILIWSELAL